MNNMQSELYPRECVACFTGHRAISEDLIDIIETKTVSKISILYNHGYRCFFNGGALGYDTIAAQAVIKAKRIHPDIVLAMALPCNDYYKKWAKKKRDLMDKILDQADEIINVSPGYFPGCMIVRDKFMVDHSSACIAYKTHEGGGTAFTVKYATKSNCLVYNLADEIISDNKIN